jgi:hypothetical protein
VLVVICFPWQSWCACCTFFSKVGVPDLILKEKVPKRILLHNTSWFKLESYLLLLFSLSNWQVDPCQLSVTWPTSTNSSWISRRRTHTTWKHTQFHRFHSVKIATRIEEEVESWLSARLILTFSTRTLESQKSHSSSCTRFLPAQTR